MDAHPWEQEQIAVQAAVTRLELAAEVAPS
jgi:hypothetical protein